MREEAERCARRGCDTYSSARRSPATRFTGTPPPEFAVCRPSTLAVAPKPWKNSAFSSAAPPCIQNRFVLVRLLPSVVVAECKRNAASVRFVGSGLRVRHRAGQGNDSEQDKRAASGEHGGVYLLNLLVYWISSETLMVCCIVPLVARNHHGVRLRRLPEEPVCRYFRYHNPSPSCSPPYRQPAAKH